MATATLSKRSKPPKPEARKDNPINAEYEDKAKALVRYAMAQKGVGIDELAKLLKTEVGIEISAGGLANKISRGGFSMAFAMQCMEAMDINLAALPR